MYDISQLNDMLVPELLELAEQLSIPHAKKLDKQDMIYKILDRQAVVSSETNEPTTEKGKRKRIVKAHTGNSTEEAEVMSVDTIEAPAPITETSKEPALRNNSNNAGIKRARKPKVKEADGVATPNVNDTALPAQVN